MLGRKLYKTKLCILHQRGRCTRQSCSFAHGEAELRRFGGPANGRRDYRGNDLRDKLGRRYSPHRRFSPARDGRGRYGFQSHKRAPHDRGYSASRSPVARRERRKRQVDGQSDASGSPKTSDYAEGQIKEGKVSSYGEIDAIEEQLKQTQLDVEMFNEHKCQLEIFFEEKAEEADKLSAKIEDLETQLNKEQEDYKRFSSKIKKFIKAHGRFLRAQEELKRSQSRLQRVYNQLDTDNSKPGNNEEDSSVHVISDGEPSGDGHISPRNETHNHTSPMKKKLRFESGTTEETKPGNLWKRERFLGTSTRVDKLSRAEVFISESETKSRELDMAIAGPIENDVQRHLVDDHKQKDINSSSAVVLSGKVRGSDSSHLLPSTSMAAHAVDDFIEAMEAEEKSEAGDAAVAFENGTRDNKAALLFLPPLPPKVTQNNYHQYQGDEEEVDVEEVDVDIGDADGNSEVEIEQV